MGEKKKNEMVGLDLARCLPNHGLFQFQMYMVNTLIGCTFYFFFFFFSCKSFGFFPPQKRGKKNDTSLQGFECMSKTAFTFRNVQMTIVSLFKRKPKMGKEKNTPIMKWVSKGKF